LRSTTESPSTESPDDETRIQECLRDAEELKSQGNDHFRASRWDEALNAYITALGRIPKKKEPQIAKEDDFPSVENPGPPRGEDLKDDEADKAEPPTELEVQCAKARATLNANIGACYIKLGDHNEAAKACTQALLDDPQYVKALQRRASSNEKINTWSSLTTAQGDYTTLIKLLPASSPLSREVARSLEAIKPRVEAAQKRETAEMLDKLKGLGNSILGNFGLSTDNFKFQPNGQGGYSMNFSQ